MMRFRSFLSAGLLFSCFYLLQAQIPGQAYIIQTNDWLSKISAKAYGNPHYYYRIIEGTNEKALTEPGIRQLSSANDLQIGQKIWIPDLSTKKTPVEDIELVSLPKNNCEIRIWYNYQVIAISKLNAKWIEDGLSLGTRAKQAYQLRHNARINARYMMPDQDEVTQLQSRDQKKYGNPDGPTFDYLLTKNTEKGLSINEAYQSIIDSASKVSPVYNSECL